MLNLFDPRFSHRLRYYQAYGEDLIPPEARGLVMTDRALIYIRSQVQGIRNALASRATKTVGTEYEMRLATVAQEAVQLTLMCADRALTQEMQRVFSDMPTSRTLRTAAIESLDETLLFLRSYNPQADFQAGTLPSRGSGLKVSVGSGEVSVPDTSQESSVFVIMPFSTEFSDVWGGAIRAACEHEGLVPIRVDMINKSSNITDDIVDSINKCRLAVIDVTDNNPNVMFELGYALAKKKPYIIISQLTEYLPFDISQIRTIVYSNTWSGIEKLRDDISDFLKQFKALQIRGPRKRKSKSAEAGEA